MSAGPLSTYEGVTGVADTGGDSMAEGFDFNAFYGVRSPNPEPQQG